MAFFIAHFCIGVVLARLGLGPYFRSLDYVQCGAYVFGVMAFFADLRAWKWLRAAFFSLAGVLWGLSHAGQSVLKGSDQGTVMMVAATSDGRGPLLVLSEDGGIFEAFGSQRSGAYGRLRKVDNGSLFSPGRLTFHPIYTPGDKVLSWWQRWQRIFHEWAYLATKNLHAIDRALIRGIVFGTKSALPKTIDTAFKNTGLYHLLVVSGLHVSMMAALFAAILKAPLQLGYSLRLVSPLIWRQLSAFLQICAALGSLAYLSLTGASAAAQRSALFFAIRQVSLVFCGDIPLTSRLLVTAFAQICFFPIGFVSEGTFMSWAAYLVVVGPSRGEAKPISRKIIGLFALQVELMILVTAVFGQLVLIGLLTNLLFVSIFPIILFACLVAIAAPWPEMSTLALEFTHSYLRCVFVFDQLTKTFPMLSIPKSLLPIWIRGLFVILGVGVVLNAFKRLSISQEGGKKHGRQTLEWAKNPHH